MGKSFGTLSCNDLCAVNHASIERAGPRYTPAVDPGAPNIRIESLIAAIDALGQSPEYRRKVSAIESRLRNAWSKAPSEIKNLFNRKNAQPEAGAALLLQLIKERPGASEKTVQRLEKFLDGFSTRIGPYEDLAYNPPPKEDGTKVSREEQQRKLHDLQQFQSPFDDLREFLRSPELSLVLNNRLFLLGSWGSGKTHFLCDVAVSRMAQGFPALLVLAQTLDQGIHPLEALCRSTGLARDPKQLLARLNKLGREKGCRALLIIDAINEGDRSSWFKHITQISNLLGNYRNVALVLSCRTPFEYQVMPKHTRAEFVQIRHQGFSEIEFDAQREFFRHYKIPSPHLPLLAPEFSKPLFLKILCETIASLGDQTKQKRINDFAAGHKGMTKLLEDFVIQMGERIEKDMKLPLRTCWSLLKGHGKQDQRVGIAPRMAELGLDYLPKAECLAIIQRVTGLKSKRASTFLSRAFAEGILAEDGIHSEGEWHEVVRLPYQRFSDHLISRHLLSQHLKTDNEASIRRSFHVDQPLGKIFEVDRWGHQYRMPGLASAIMLEFPERARRKLPDDNRELVFYLPKKNQLSRPLADAFIEGLVWRDIKSFCKDTDGIVSHYLGSKNPIIKDQMLEAITSLASRTGHPFNAKRLFSFLAKKSLIERDLFWSEFLRTREASSAVYRVLDWIVSGPLEGMKEETAINLAVLCASILTTTVRPLRDKATRCLVLLGERFPRALFPLVLENLSHSDPYVPERLLAAGYGVMMRVWAFPPPSLKEALVPLVDALDERLRGDASTAPIEHILMRDYASGILSLAAKVSDYPGLDPAAPISSVSRLPKASNIQLADVEAAKAAIQMDFDNYTTGRIVSNRRNYDEEHVDYQGVQRQIRWRILDLGFEPETFKQIDSIIGSSNFHSGRKDDGGKTDRYGKKYSWIAFFEVAGRRLLDGILPDRDNPRLSDTDIDPSFPEPGINWSFPLNPLFAAPFRSAPHWLEHGASPDYRHLLQLEEIDGVPGPWVLLDGYIGEFEPASHRGTFTFLRGFLIANRQIEKFQRLAREVEYPGNDGVPSPWEDHYVFAGEIGWSPKVLTSLRRADGTAKPQVSRAFDRTEHKLVYRRYGSLSTIEKFRLRFPEVRGADGKGEKIPRDRLVAVNDYKHIPGVSVEVPTMRMSWESYHSSENQAGHPDYASPSIVESLGLVKSGGAVDLPDREGRPATLYRQSGGSWSKERREVIYIRADLMRKYLGKSRKRLIWFNWGEREIDYDYAESVNLRDDPKMQALWGLHSHIHRQLSLWDGNSVKN